MKQHFNSYLPEWDSRNCNHIAKHGLKDYQIEELFYGEGIYQTIVVKNKKNKSGEKRYKLLGADASGTFIKAIIAIYSKRKLWRCVTAVKMTLAEKRSFLKFIGVK